MGVKRGLKGWHQLLKLVEGETGQIQELRGAELQIGEPYIGHSWCLLLVETQYTINRDKLKRMEAWQYVCLTARVTARLGGRDAQAHASMMTPTVAQSSAD